MCCPQCGNEEMTMRCGKDKGDFRGHCDCAVCGFRMYASSDSMDGLIAQMEAQLAAQSAALEAQ